MADPYLHRKGGMVYFTHQENLCRPLSQISLIDADGVRPYIRMSYRLPLKVAKS